MYGVWSHTWFTVTHDIPSCDYKLAGVELFHHHSLNSVYRPLLIAWRTLGLVQALYIESRHSVSGAL